MAAAHDWETIRLISDTCVSVIRDRSISSAYGLYLSEHNAPPKLTCFFSPIISEKLRQDFDKYHIDANKLWLYSGLGDFYSQLSRLLTVCRETDELKQYVEKANSKLSEIFEEYHSNDFDYIRHLRNVVAHGKVAFDTEECLMHFIDTRHDGSTSAEFTLDHQQVSELIEILLHDVLLSYLSDIGWALS